MITNTYKLNMQPGGVPLIIHVSQYDVGETMTFNLVNTATSSSISSGVSAEIRGTKPDGNGFSYSATYSYSNSNATVSVVIKDQMTAVAGQVVCEIILYKGAPPTTQNPSGTNYQQLGTANFILNVERAALDKDTLTSESSIRQLVNVIDNSQQIIAAGAAASQASSTVQSMAQQAAQSATSAVSNAESCAQSAQAAATSAQAAATSAEDAARYAREASGDSSLIMDDYYNKTEIDNKLSAKANTSSIPTKTSQLTNNSGFITKSVSDLTYYSTKTQTKALSDFTYYYTKTQVDTALGAKANSSDVYTKTQTDTLLSAKANSADVYTKTQVDTSLGTKLDKDLSTLTALPQAPTSSDLFAVKSGSDTYKVRFDTIRNAISYSNAGSHNSIYRGENLGNSVTSSQYAQIAAGTFDDLFIGDYWTINGVNWRIADFDYWLNTGDTSCETHHVVIVPDTVLATCAMNSTGTTAGAYVGSNFYTGANGNAGRATARTAVINAFGATHILTHREMFANAVTNGAESGQDFYDSQIELMNECMAYGSNVFHNILPVNTFYPAFYTMSKNQLSLFRYRHDLIGIRAGWWLRDVCSSDTFAAVRDSGFSCLDFATSVNGVRPAFGLISA